MLIALRHRSHMEVIRRRSQSWQVRLQASATSSGQLHCLQMRHSTCHLWLARNVRVPGTYAQSIGALTGCRRPPTARDLWCKT
eukprot:3932300-Amphidinium_carterae.2